MLKNKMIGKVGKDIKGGEMNYTQDRDEFGTTQHKEKLQNYLE